MQTVSELRAAIEAGKAEASRNLRRDFGTDDGRAILARVFAAIPGSASPQAALSKAKAA